VSSVSSVRLIVPGLREVVLLGRIAGEVELDGREAARAAFVRGVELEVTPLAHAVSKGTSPSADPGHAIGLGRRSAAAASAMRARHVERDRIAEPTPQRDQGTGDTKPTIGAPVPAS
jgi:hypothetical protein